MKRKSIVIILVITLIGLFCFGIFEYKAKNNQNKKINTDVNTKVNLPYEQREILQSLVGLESKNMKILNNPLRVEGNFYIPENTILTVIERYLKQSNNDQIEDLQIVINKNALAIKGKYRLFANFKTSIDIDIIPSVTKEGNVKLTLKDIKVLSFSLSDNLTDAVIESWFSNLDNVTVDDGNVIIDKSFFKNTEITSMNIEEDYLIVGLRVNF